MPEVLTQKEAEKRSLNVNIKMIGKYLGIDIKIEFMCPFCEKIFIATPYNIFNKKIRSCGCYAKKCSSATLKNKYIRNKITKTKRQPIDGNNLQEKYPEIAKEWYSNKNNNTPNDVNWSCNDKKWWICQNGHEYQYCVGQKILEKFNDLTTTNPGLLEEWDYNKNTIKPTEISEGSHKKVWWVCKSCNHKWNTSINSRSLKNKGCPRCNESKGEKEVVQILDQHNILYIKEKTFKECQDIRKLRFDFFLPEYNCCIEYNGEQHYKIGTGYFNNPKRFKLIQKRDKIKIEFCKTNNIKLIIIPYTQYNHIEEILLKELNIKTNQPIL